MKNKRCTIIGIIGVIRYKNKYLITRRYDPGTPFHNRWQFPGGGLEFGEAPEETLKREIKEEVGLDIDKYKLISIILSKQRNKKSWHGIFISYLCKPKLPLQSIVLNDEATKYKWVTPKEIIDISQDKCFIGTKQIVKEAKKMKL